MQQTIEELKGQIESLKTELLALPSVGNQSEIDDLQAYIRISTELLKAVAALQVIKNVEPNEEETENQITISEPEQEPEPEIGTLESVIQQPAEPIEQVEPEPVIAAQKETVKSGLGSAKPAEEGIEVAEMLANNAISDLKSAFGLNERFYYTNELFAGDGQEFIRAINEFNHLGSFEDAKRLIDAKYKPQFGWKDDNEVVVEFVTILKRRYS